jgi:MFS transporter, DHA2 family, multidrug resistance protein
MNTTATVATAASIPRAGFVVPLALAGSFVANLGAQFAGAHVPDIQAGLGASENDASWITTLYTVATFFAFALSPLLARTFGIRRLFLASAAVFAVAAGASAIAPELNVLLAARVAQGLAGGMFGPMAFVAIFRSWSGPRLPFGFALLAIVLLVSFNSGPALAGPIEAASGWRALFFAQVVLAVPLIFAGLRWLPQAPLNANGHRGEWAALFLLAIATGSLVVLLAQGTRRGWFDSGLMVSMALLSLVAWIGFVIAHRLSPVRVLHGRKLLDRRFGIPIALNFVFRASFAATAYLLPLLLASTRADGRSAICWLLLPQIAAFPLVWRWLQRVDHRVPMALGLVFVAGGIGVVGFASILLPGLVLTGVGQVLFLVPALMTGASSLKPEHGPTATIVFNMTTVGGTTLAVGLLSTFVNARVAAPAVAWPAINEAFFLLAIALLLATPFVMFIGRIRGAADSAALPS